MQNHKRVLFITAWLSGVAYAETPPPQPTVMEAYTLQRLEQIQAETVLLEAKAARARIQRELEESGIDARTANLPLNGRELAILPRAGGLPSVEEIYGSGQQLMARLVLSDGKRAELRQGEQIPGTRFWVEAISALLKTEQKRYGKYPSATRCRYRPLCEGDTGRRRHD